MKKTTFLLLLWSVAWLHGCSDGESAISPDLGGGNDSGTGGSLARFTIADDKLYIVDQTNLRTYDIRQADNPRATTTVPIGFGIETVFPYGDNLFVGAADAMYIFDISNPSQPRQLSRYSHFVGCDPVVVQGNYAYVTLRTAGCRPNTNNNVLDVIDISDLRNPRLVQTYNMTSPYGLGIRGSSLFVCEGDAGLRVFDATDPVRLVQKSFLTDIKTYDLIPLPQSLLVIGQDGFYQYDYSNLAQLNLLSKITVEQN
ncbi:MAG: hypothetical protein MUD08_02230 [Cytophagales bacterium]|jgi:hypothetical protein|nr:hypothetical protein [Cytophagales bacterium]